MANQAPSYEVALFGDFYSKDLRAVLTRCALHAEHTYPFHAREVVFEPIDALAQREAGTEPVLLRARREIRIVNDDESVPDDMKKKMSKKRGKGTLNEQEADAEWILYSYLKPESTRVHPEATVRPSAVTEVVGNALEFASALGYVRRSQICKRGYAFRRGILVIHMFQQEFVNEETDLPIPAHPDTLWEVEVKTAAPVRNSTETPLAGAVEAVLDVQRLMKGLIDLKRQDG